MGLPLGVTIVIVYGLYMNEMARRLVSYRRGLETEIERRVGVPVALWSSRVNRGRYATDSIKAMLALAATVYGDRARPNFPHHITGRVGS
jgi:hypothetical protein